MIKFAHNIHTNCAFLKICNNKNVIMEFWKNIFVRRNELVPLVLPFKQER